VTAAGDDNVNLLSSWDEEMPVAAMGATMTKPETYRPLWVVTVGDHEWGTLMVAVQAVHEQDAAQAALQIARDRGRPAAFTLTTVKLEPSAVGGDLPAWATT